MAGIPLYMQWPLTSQLHVSFLNEKPGVDFSKLQFRPKSLRTNFHPLILDQFRTKTSDIGKTLYYDYNLGFKNSKDIKRSKLQTYIEPFFKFRYKCLPKQFRETDSWGRCYDHNFVRFFPIFGEK
jgi:hypothetical protein